MSFAFSGWLFNELVFPTLCLVFLLIPLVRLVVRLAKRGFNSVDFSNYGVGIMLIAMVAIVAILVSILLHGGIHLVYERPADALTVSGTVESIESRRFYEGNQHTVNNSRSNGYYITVDGVTCAAMAQGELEVGDTVTVTYLPNSGFILSVTEQ